MTTSSANPVPAFDDDAFILINGETSGGNQFRPSDWCDRLHSTLRVLDSDEYAECSEHVHLININGRKGILIDCALKQINSQLYDFFLSFVNNNDLIVKPFSRDNWNDLNKK